MRARMTCQKIISPKTTFKPPRKYHNKVAILPPMIEATIAVGASNQNNSETTKVFRLYNLACPANFRGGSSVFLISLLRGFLPKPKFTKRYTKVDTNQAARKI